MLRLVVRQLLRHPQNRLLVLLPQDPLLVELLRQLLPQLCYLRLLLVHLHGVRFVLLLGQLQLRLQLCDRLLIPRLLFFLLFLQILELLLLLLDLLCLLPDNFHQVLQGPDQLALSLLKTLSFFF